MPKGIRKACANCIKARLACDEGRPCQRCIVHQCECVAVPRKPRVKKQKLDLEPPSDTKPTHIPTIDSSVEIVTPNWASSDFMQGAYSSFQLEKVNTPNEEPLFEGFSSPVTGVIPSPPTRLSPVMESSPTITMSSSPQLQSPFSSSQTPSPLSWSQNNYNKILQQYANSPLSMPLRNLQAIQQAVQLAQQQVQQPQQQPQSPQQTQPQPQQQQSQQTPLQAIQQQMTLQSTLQSLIQQPQQQQQQQQPLLPPPLPYDASQMMALLLDEKPTTLLNEWPDTQLTNYLDGQQILNFNMSCLSPPLKSSKITKPHSNPMSSLPQPKNSTPLFPSPIAIFDKQKFQLLDANEAMAKFVGHNTVAELSTVVITMDDLIDPEAAHIAKNALTNFVTIPSPCFRICDIRTRGGQSKTVEFHVDLTEQLLIFSIKSVFDTCSSMALPETPSPAVVKKDITQMCNCKACEFLSPID